MRHQPLGIAILLAMVGLPALAQVTPDGTVGTAVNSIVAPGIDTTAPYTITEGSMRSDGTNATLFHSFDTFSPGTDSVTFDLRSASNAVDTSAVNQSAYRITVLEKHNRSLDRREQWA